MIDLSYKNPDKKEEDCYRFIDKDEDGDNKYTALCSMALMTEAAELFEALQRMLEGLEKQ